MASTSALTVQKSFKYDVFLSFRGEDTRKNFVDHLYHALQRKSIITYKDDEEIRKGKRISDELIRSIEESKFYIIVFSKNYASSSWCLDELVKIMECQEMHGHTAYPVFYDVEPTEVRNQSGAVGEAFAKHVNAKAAGRWRDALTKAAGLAGRELKNTFDGHEAKFINKVVEDISLQLRFINSRFDKKLIGMETRVEDVVLSLETNIDDVRMIGIKGMGGAGKTTLARVAFDQISFWFDGSSFVENVREFSKNELGGLKSLQKQVLSDVLKDPNITVNGVYEGKNMMKKYMSDRKVLIVLDDVDHIDQLEALVGEPNWFKPGSRIIITTRDKQVLVAHRVNKILDVNLLSHEEAISLFSRFAFGSEIPIQGYEEQSEQVVSYASGLPLTIKVLGSFLCGKDELEWTDALERLKTIPLKETLEILELGYNSLEEDYKEIFLDMACILKSWRRWKKVEALIALESCGFHVRNGLRVLEQKSLITLYNNWDFDMHDHLEEMGKNIVRRLHPNEPYKHSRLWVHEEIEDILVEEKGTAATRCIKVRNVDPLLVMKGLRNMKELRFLDVIGRRKVGSDFKYTDYDSDSGCFSYHDGADLDYTHVDEDSLYLPNSLQYLSWDGYPFTGLPKSFKANNLVCLKMRFSNIDQLWDRGERQLGYKVKNAEFRKEFVTV
ncbi:putative TIR domain, P-loop containing nucleoside triphosphate hydrolase [Helianthus debilis subsp. tardiflorus]